MKTMKKPFKNQTGFTLIELMISLFVLSLVIAGYVGANVKAQQNSEEMHERTIAIQDANRAIEQMRDYASKPGVVFPAGFVSNVKYPNNYVFPKVKSGSLTDAEVFNSLTNETVTATYANEETTVNPLDVTITVTWLSYTRRLDQEAVETYITQR